MIVRDRIAAPRTTHSLPPSTLGIAALLASLALSLAPARIQAQPVLGFIEEFPGTSIGTWGAAFTLVTNPGSGGYLGPGDGYLKLQTTMSNQFGARSFDEQYTGNWTAAGITQVRLWLNDVGTDDPLEIHFSVGDGTANFWQYNVGFVPPLHAWGVFVVDLTSGANWTQILGSGTFASALTTVDRIHLRHDPPPFAHVPTPPDPIVADLGLDHILLTDGLVGVGPSPRVTNPVELAPPYPNPSRGPVSLVVRAADAGPITIQIVDAAGRAVRRAVLPDAGSGHRTWMWDGTNDAGRRVPAGYYRVHAIGPSGGMSRPLMRVE